MTLKIKHITFLIFIISQYSCSGKLRTNENLISAPTTHADTVWIDFKNAMITGQIEYLIKNSSDSIDCVDCIDSNLEDYYDSKLIFSDYLDKLMHVDNLDNYKYLIDETDSMIYVNYQIKSRFAEEGKYNLIYIFKKSTDKYLFKGMITVP